MQVNQSVKCRIRRNVRRNGLVLFDQNAKDSVCCKQLLLSNFSASSADISKAFQPDDIMSQM